MRLKWILSSFILIMLGSALWLWQFGSMIRGAPRIAVRYVPGSWHTTSTTGPARDTARDARQPLRLDPEHPLPPPEHNGRLTTGQFERDLPDSSAVSPNCTTHSALPQALN